MTTSPHLYLILLGADWASLPAITRALHSPVPVAEFTGKADISRGTNGLARMIASLLGLPEAGQSVETRVKVSRVGDDELLERWYAGQRFATLQMAEDGLLVERFGPFVLRFKLIGHERGIDFEQKQVSVWGLPLADWGAPQVRASERADGDTHCFDVEMRLPGVGRVIAYQGQLKMSAA
jgi:hypothetical protein